MTAVVDAFGLVLAPGAPLLMLLMWCVPGLRPRVACWLPWAAAPALFVALGGTPGTIARLDWILFGAVLGFDELNRWFLAFTAILWLGAGLSARGYIAGDPRADSFRLLWLATMAGNFGLILALDVASFYASFALMTFAAYGLVIHSRSIEALHAGRVYLVMAIIGEALILTGLLLAASGTATPLLPTLPELAAAITVSPRRDLVIACLFLGFGIKAGLPLLHMWLPLAHPVAPIPASAVLSGAMIKAGVLGWLSTLPLGLVGLPLWSFAIMFAGLVAAFGGALIGIHQRTPKTVLAYSSISQMGLITVGVGAGLQEPASWTVLGPAVTLYALHHGLAKGALFLGVGIARNSGGRLGAAWLWVLLALPALSLTGLMTSGAVAKLTLKHALADGVGSPAWWGHLPWLLGIAAVGTTVLMARYLWLLRDQDQGAAAPRSEWLGWGVLLVTSGVAVFALPAIGLDGTWPVRIGEWIELAWPVIAGVLLALSAAPRLTPWPIPAGDILVSIMALGTKAMRGPGRAMAAIHERAVAGRARSPGSGQVRHDRAGRSTFLEQIWRRDAALVFTALLVMLLLAIVTSGILVMPHH